MKGRADIEGIRMQRRYERLAATSQLSMRPAHRCDRHSEAINMGHACVNPGSRCCPNSTTQIGPKGVLDPLQVSNPELSWTRRFSNRTQRRFELSLKFGTAAKKVHFQKPSCPPCFGGPRSPTPVWSDRTTLNSASCGPPSQCAPTEVRLTMHGPYTESSLALSLSPCRASTCKKISMNPSMQ